MEIADGNRSRRSGLCGRVARRHACRCRRRRNAHQGGARHFGPLEITKVGSQGVGTNLVILSTIDANGKVVPADHRLAMRNKANQLWHSDSTFKRVPALASVLSARIIPVRGGETEYVSTRLAWERLDQELRDRLERSFAWHDYAHSRGKIAADLASAEERAALPPQCWRLAWKNPANGT